MLPPPARFEVFSWSTLPSIPRLALGLLAFAAVWLAHLSSVSLTPPVDNIEQLTWVRSLEWGYYKHPPLPTWLAWAPVRLLGLSASTSYLLGACCTLGALTVMWRLLVVLRDTRHANVALLAGLCISYYNGRLYYYNHNVVLLLLSTTSAALCWQAFATRQWRWWLALGVTIGLGALTKYQIAVTVVSVVAFAAHQRAWRDPVHRVGGLLAMLVALLLFVPHVEWLRAHDFGPIRYAVDSSLGAGFGLIDRMGTAAHWLVDQVLNRALAAWLLLAVAAWSSGAAPAPVAPAAAQPRGGDSARALLLAWGLVPLLFMPLVGILLGADLQLQWGTPFLLFAVPGVMELWPRSAWSRCSWPTTVTAFVAVQALLLLSSQLTSPHGPAFLRDHHWRAFDAAALAERLAAPARTALGGPIHVVIGPAGPAGALALQLPERPVVLIDGRLDRSPWVAPDLVARCGALELGRPNTLAGGEPVGPDLPDLDWRVVPRRPGAAACPQLSID